MSSFAQEKWTYSFQPVGYCKPRVPSINDNSPLTIPTPKNPYHDI